MTFVDFYKNLSAKERETYHKRAGCAPNYIDAHLIHARRTPRPGRMEKMVEATDGAVSWNEMLSHFYPAAGGELVSKSGSSHERG